MNNGCPEYREIERTSRRSLLRVGAAGFAGLNLPGILRASESGKGPAPKAKSVLFLHQWGGPSHIDTFDMKPHAPEKIRGMFRPIQSNTPGLPIVEHLPNFAKILGMFAQVRSVHHTMKNHNSAGYYSLTGHAPPLDDQRLRDSRELYPSYGSVVARFKPVDDPALPTYASFPWVIRDGSNTPGQGASFLGQEYAPFFVGQDPNRPNFRLPELSLPGSLTVDRLDDRRGLLRTIDRQADLLSWNDTAQGLDAFHSRAVSMLASPKVKKAFDLSQEPQALHDAYGRTTYGQSCLLARRLLEAGVRFVTVYFSQTIGNGTKDAKAGWDTHKDNFTDLKERLLPITDQTMPTLMLDLKARGLLDETLVVWMGEFGRTPKVAVMKEYPTPGRDHWPNCYTALLAGGGIRPGAVYGSSDRLGAYPNTDPVRPDDLAATMFWALGIAPETEVRDTLGRPLPISAGKPLTTLFG